MKNYAINQHFVPQFYLKQFTDKDDKLHCYNKHSHEKYSAHTIDICRKKNLYETEYDIPLKNGEKYIVHNGIENMFKDVEGTYSTMLPKILSKCINNCNGVSLICSTAEKLILADMVTNFLVRNPYAVEGFLITKLHQK